MNIQSTPNFRGKYIVQGTIEDIAQVEQVCRNNKFDINSLSTLRLRYGQDKCISIFATNADSITLQKAKNDKENPIKTDKTKGIKENIIGILKQVFKKNIASTPVVQAADILDVPPKKNQYRYFDVKDGHFFGRETTLLDGTKEEYSYIYNEIGEKKGLKSRTEANGIRTEYYPSTGELKSITNPDGSSREYSTGCKLKSEILADGTKKNYTEKGILKSIRTPDGTLTIYWENGNIKSVKSPDGHTEYYTEKGFPAPPKKLMK